MRSLGTFVLALGIGLGFSDDAHASGVIDPPVGLAYAVAGLAVAAAAGVVSNVTFTTIDVVHAARGERLARNLAFGQSVGSGAQLAALVWLGAHESNNPYVLGYTAWTAALTAHGVYSLATAVHAAPEVRESRRLALAPSVSPHGVNVSVSSVW